MENLHLITLHAFSPFDACEKAQTSLLQRQIESKLFYVGGTFDMEGNAFDFDNRSNWLPSQLSLTNCRQAILEEIKGGIWREEAFQKCALHFLKEAQQLERTKRREEFLKWLDEQPIMSSQVRDKVRNWLKVKPTIKTGWWDTLMSYFQTKPDEQEQWHRAMEYCHWRVEIAGLPSLERFCLWKHQFRADKFDQVGITNWTNIFMDFKFEDKPTPKYVVLIHVCS